MTELEKKEKAAGRVFPVQRPVGPLPVKAKRALAFLKAIAAHGEWENGDGEPITKSVLALIDWVEKASAARQLAEIPHPRRLHGQEIERLRAALAKANEQAERFESGWYLRGDALEAIKKHCEPQPSALAAAIVATCDNGLKA